MNILYLFRLGSSEAGLTYLYTLGIPAPICDYDPFSIVRGQGDGGQARLGYKRARWVWTEMTPYQALALQMAIQEALDDTGVIYATLHTNTGAWLDVSGQPHMPQFSPAGSISRPDAPLQNVELTMNNISIINNPASF